MAADLHIHVFEEGQLTEEDFRIFFHNCIGSKWCPITNAETDEDFAAIFQQDMEDAKAKPSLSERKWQEVHPKLTKCPDVWIGSVSWLKADLLDDGDTYIPSTVGAVSDIIGEELPVIDDELIGKVKAAFELPNETTYRLADPGEVIAFLEQHKGKQAFTVSW